MLENDKPEQKGFSTGTSKQRTRQNKKKNKKKQADRQHKICDVRQSKDQAKKNRSFQSESQNPQMVEGCTKTMGPKIRIENARTKSRLRLREKEIHFTLAH